MSLVDDTISDPVAIDLFGMELLDFQEFQSKLSTKCATVTSLIQGIFVPTANSASVHLQNRNVDLKALVEQNRQYKQVITAKTEELATKQSEYEKAKQDRKVLSQEIKDTHEALLMAKKYYKKYLKFYYTIEKTMDSKQIIFVQFFTESKNENNRYSIRLHRDIKNATYTLEEMNPVLKSFKELQSRLKESNDLPGTLCLIRQAFLKHKSK